MGDRRPSANRRFQTEGGELVATKRHCAAESLHLAHWWGSTRAEYLHHHGRKREALDTEMAAAGPANESLMNSALRADDERLPFR